MELQSFYKNIISVLRKSQKANRLIEIAGK